MTRKFKTFTAKLNDKDVVFKVYEPVIVDYKEATKARNEAFVEALQSKAPLRSQINTLLRSRGEWDDERETQFNNWNKDILDKEKQLKSGGMKLSQARTIALEMRELREKLQNLLADRSNLDNMTAEGQADNAHFNSLVSSCLVYNNEKGEEIRYFNSLEDYLVSGATEIAAEAAKTLATMLYTIGDNVQKSLPENQFLIRRGFMDEKMRLINKDGHLIDSEGRLIDEEGYYVDEQGRRVDKFGSPVDNKGNYIVEFKPFLDDDGNEIKEETKVEDKTEAK
jgi:hypothetical protein